MIMIVQVFFGKGRASTRSLFFGCIAKGIGAFFLTAERHGGLVLLIKLGLLLLCSIYERHADGQPKQRHHHKQCGDDW